MHGRTAHALQKLVVRTMAASTLLGATPAMADISPFKTPSGNIECSIAEEAEGAVDLRCRIFERSGAPALPRPENCGDAWGHIFALFASGRVKMECGLPGRPSAATGIDVASYGAGADWGGIQCHSSTAGLECRNSEGHGFFLSRARQSVF